MNIIERIISQEVNRYVKVARETTPFFRVIDSHVKNFLYDPNKRLLILVVDKDKYDRNRGIYVAIKRFLQVYAPFKEFLSDLGVPNYDIVYAFPYTEKEYYHLAKSNVTPFTRILRREEQMTVMLGSADKARKKVEVLNDSLQALVKDMSPNKRTQLQFLLELLLSQKPTPSNKPVIDDYDLYRFLHNLYTYLFGKIPERRDIQAVITDENAELFKNIIDRHFLINWDGVEGSTLREKVINVLLEYGFGIILEILASVDFEMVKLLQGQEKEKKKGKKSKSKKSKSSSKKTLKKIKEEAKEELTVQQEVINEPEPVTGEAPLSNKPDMSGAISDDLEVVTASEDDLVGVE